MKRRRDLLGILALLLAAGWARTAEQTPYDEKADASQQVASAIADASRQGKNVVLVFGANWCPDCRTLDAEMHKPDLVALLAKSFVVVKIDVGRMDKNLDLAKKYGVPVRRGIPAMAVLDPHGKLLYAQDQGQFSNARRMAHESFKSFFERWRPKG